MGNKTHYHVCKRCLMDTSDPEIEFDHDGVCNYCRDFLKARSRYTPGESLTKELERLVSNIREQGRNRKYDCIVGMSGGLDSTYVAYTAKKLGLRPLAVHVDNGWNSELSVNNIENVLKNLDIDLYTHVIDWEEFRDLQVSFLRASVSDAEIPTDHAIRTVLYQVARREGIKYLFNGRNYSTEGILARSWSYGALDWKYIKSVHRRFGRVQLQNYPHMTLSQIVYNAMVIRVKNIGILNYVPYNKKNAVEVLQNELGWRDYGGKHYESIYTRFFQAYILPRKFNIDKRKAYLSVLILTGQNSRDEALQIIQEPTYDQNKLEEDKQYVLKKLRLTEDEFEKIMTASVKSYINYPNHSRFLLLDKNPWLFRLAKLLRIIRILPQGFADHAIPKKNTI